MSPLRSFLLVAPWIALGCDHAPNFGPVTCGFVVNLALVSPSFPQLHIGDAVTMRATWDAGVARDCLPPDTTAAGLWWWAWPEGIVTIDSTTGRLTALRPGLGMIFRSQKGDSGALGGTRVGVFEPPGADSVVTIIRNRTGDSAWVVVEDASGTTQRAQTIGPHDSTCWVTPLSDSVRYSVTIRPPPQPVGSDSTMVGWLTHLALEFDHAWFIGVSSGSVGIYGQNPDPGGC